MQNSVVNTFLFILVDIADMYISRMILQLYYSQLAIKSTERRGILLPGARPRQHSDPVLGFMKENIIQNRSHLRNPSDVTKLQFVTPRKMRALMMMMMRRRRRRRRMSPRV